MPSSSGRSAPDRPIVPGAVFRLDPMHVVLPRREGAQPARETRSVVVVSNKRDCRDDWCPTVIVLPLSAQLQHFNARHDVEIAQGDGGTDRDVMAQADLAHFILKSDLLSGELRGVLLRDTQARIKVVLGNVLGIDVPAITSPPTSE